MNDRGPPYDSAAALAELREEFQGLRQQGPLSAEAMWSIVARLRDIPRSPNADGHLAFAFDVMMNCGHDPFSAGPEYPLVALLGAAWAGVPDEAAPTLARRWYSVRAHFCAQQGLAAEAARCLASAHGLATENGDRIGLTAVYSNVALLANGCGQYEDGVRFASASLELSANGALAEVETSLRAQSVISALKNRGCALQRLGRFEQALSDFLHALGILTCSGGAPGGRTSHARELAAVCGELHLAMGRIPEAGLFLDSLDDAIAPQSSDAMMHVLAVRRARALLSMARGEHGAGLAELRAVLADAEKLLPVGATDDAVVDALYALELACRITGDTAGAQEARRRVAARLKAAAEAALDVLAAEPDLAMSSNLPQAMRAIDARLDRRGRIAGAADGGDVASLQQLVALASQASSLEDSSGEHGVRVAALARAVGAALGLDPDRVNRLALAALVHDAGKIGVARSLLVQVEPLDDGEQSDYDDHAESSAELIERSALPDRSAIAQIVRLHHQPFDGVRAARPARGEALPLEARILAACDRFDALVMGRPRAAAVSIDAALRQLLQAGGRELDPAVVTAVVEAVRELRARHPDLMSELAADAEHYDYTASRRLLRRAADSVTRAA